MKIIAHRGATSHFDENTLESVLKAIELPFDGVEFDVRRTRDRRIILMHDTTIERTTDGTGRVSRLGWDELEAVRTTRGQTVPELSAVMRRLVTTNKLINIEIKSHGCAETVAEFAGHSNVYISSPLSSELREVKRLVPSAKLGFVTSNPISLLLAARNPLYTFITLHKILVNARVIRFLYKQRKQSWVFPIDDAADIAKMRSLAVSAIFSDIEPR